jgi:F-type H+-transporting ATPase subunit delta
MAESLTIARPYAKAAFETAQAKQQLAAWSKMLAAAAAGVSEPAVQILLGSPKLPKQQVAQIFIELVGQELGDSGANFIRLLAENRRLGLLPVIAQMFEQLRADAERTIEATVISASPLGEGERAALARALKKRLNRDVTLQCETDSRLIGGAVIRAGDLVIDGSVRSKLERLGMALAR